MDIAAASGRFDDQLRAGPIDVCRAVGAVHAESAQGGLDPASVLTRVACDSWFRCGRATRQFPEGDGIYHLVVTLADTIRTITDGITTAAVVAQALWVPKLSHSS